MVISPQLSCYKTPACQKVTYFVGAEHVQNGVFTIKAMVNTKTHSMFCSGTENQLTSPKRHVPPNQNQHAMHEIQNPVITGVMLTLIFNQPRPVVQSYLIH